MRSLPWRQRLGAGRSPLELDERLVAIVAPLSAHGIRELADVLSAGRVERMAVFCPPCEASIAGFGVVLDVPRALAHAGALPGGRLKFLGGEG